MSLRYTSIVSTCCGRCFSTVKENVKRASPGFWLLKENRREFLLSVAKKLNVRTYEDWGNVSARTVMNLGGGSALSQFKGSLYKLLRNTFPEVKWELSWFKRVPRNYWDDISNRQKYLLQLSKKLGVQKYEDWGKISYRKLLKIGSSGILVKYNNSLLKVLRETFPDVHWKEEWFHHIPSNPSGFWKVKSNQRQFMDSLIKKLNIQDIKSWGIGKHSAVIEHGGRSLVFQYGGSLSKALRSIYPELKWEIPASQKYSPEYWNRIANHREFLDSIAADYNLSKPSDWKRVSSQLITKRGGKGLLRIYNNSLMKALETIYPMTNWMNNFAFSVESEPQFAVLGLTRKLVSRENL